MNPYVLALLVVGAVAVLFLAPDSAMPSILLAYLVIIGYGMAWTHRIAPLVATIIMAVCIVIYMDTAISIVVQDTGSEGLYRLMEVGPAIITLASLGVGYFYSWTRRPLHMVVCVFLAVSSLVLGW